MKYNPPYYLRGETGKSLDAGWHTLEALGIHAATLTLRSLDADDLVFSLRATPGRIIPDDGQWLTLQDADGLTLFTGIAARRFLFPAGIYQYSAVNTYRGLLQTPLTDPVTNRPYILFNMGDLSVTLLTILARAQALGLPIQPPPISPPMFAVPKMAFRAASCGSAFEDALKWIPDAASSMDYGTSPPTLRLACRASATPVQISLDTPGHGCTALDLTAVPESRALFVAFVYAVRRDALLVDYSIQQAGDPEADAHRSMSIYLSGMDRTEMMVSEALVTSNNALGAATLSLQNSINAVNAVNAQIAATYAAAVAASEAAYSATGVFNAAAYAAAHDSALTAGTTAGVTWVDYNVGLWPWTSTTADTGYGTIQYSSVGLFYVLASSPTIARYPIGVCVPGTFTAAQLTTAGAVKESGLIKGEMMFQSRTGNHGYGQEISGWPSNHYVSQQWADYSYQSWWRGTLAGTAVDFLSKTPSAIRDALNADALAVKNNTTVNPGASTNSFIDQAAFVDAPADLAANYFARQDWMPYQGQLALSPTAQTLPAPGDFVSISGGDLPAEFATMATPVRDLTLDLATGAATVTLGAPARMTYASLQDRLRIPVEDNYKPA